MKRLIAVVAVGLFLYLAQAFAPAVEAGITQCDQGALLATQVVEVCQ